MNIFFNLTHDPKLIVITVQFQYHVNNIQVRLNTAVLLSVKDKVIVHLFLVQLVSRADTERRVR